MQSLIVSFIRFTTAVTLYTLEQIQTSAYVTQGGQDIFKILDKLEIALDSMTESLADKIDQKKKDTLESITQTATDVVDKGFDSVGLMNPSKVLKTTNELWQKSSEVVTDWFKKSDSTNGSAPRPAAEALP